MKRIGVLGGSFDPVHIGHLLLAEQAIEEGGLDKVYLVPTYIQPFKPNGSAASNKERLEMLRLATTDNDKIEISTVELDENEVSFTYNTLCKLRETCKMDSKITFILGSDAFMNIETWHNAAGLLSEFSFMVGVRPGDDIPRIQMLAGELTSKYGSDIYIIQNRQIDLSSSEIKDRIENRKTIRYMVPIAVKYYIENQGLYSGKCKAVRDFIEKNISSCKRKAHIYSTAKEATRLARHYGYDVHKAHLAGLYHDIYKELDENSSDEYVRKMGISDYYIGKRNLAHSKIAAACIGELFGEFDEEIVNAVAYHTTGKADMTMLEKIVFLADLIEENRDYPDVSDLRKTAYSDIDKACGMALKRCIEVLKRDGEYIDNDTVSALEFYKKYLMGEDNE